MARKDEDNVHLGLQQHGRVHRVALRAPSSSLRTCLEPMDKLFPRLGDLSLSSTTAEEMDLMLPETFQAPILHCLVLHGVRLPAGLPLLASSIALSTLSMTHIGTSSYFPPGHLVAQLQGLPHLEELSIGFAIPIPLPSNEGELLHPPIPRVELPTLKRLTFRGVDIYINNLVAHIDTPVLERLNLILFFDLAFTLVNLSEFIHRTNEFGCLFSRIFFKKDGAFIDAGPHEQRGMEMLSLHVNCKSLDWQIDSATLVCDALRKVLLATEELTLDLDVNGMPSVWENSLDGVLWHELLLPFTGVKKLYIGYSLALELSRALETVSEELLPKLQELDIQLEIEHAKVAFSTFVKTRESLRLPIRLLASPIPHRDAEPEVPRADMELPRTTPEVHRMDPAAFLNYMDYVGRPYQNQAMVLINLCRLSIVEQKQSSRSYDKLRR